MRNQLEQISEYLAFKLKEARKLQKWSLDRASEETGVSKAMLGQIERGESSPTVATLWKIATGFHTSLSYFLAPTNELYSVDKKSSVSVHKEISNQGITVKTLSPYDHELNFEWFELILSVGFKTMSDPHGKGVVELITVTKGQLEVYIGDEWMTLSQGEALRFAADQYHGYRNTTNEQVIFHNVIFYKD